MVLAMLLIQSLDLLIKFSFCSYLGVFVILLQALFTVPLIALSTYLFIRFKKAYSRHTMKNLTMITALMLIENGLNGILRFFVGLKAFLSQDQQKIYALINFVLPVIFAIIWLNIRVISLSKNGFYGAPLSRMQEKSDKEDCQDDPFPDQTESTKTSAKKNDSDDEDEEENLYFDQDIECQPLFKPR